MDGQKPCCRARRVPALFPYHGAGDVVGVIFPLVLGLSPGHHRRRIGGAVSVSGGPNAPGCGTGTHGLIGASAVPGGGGGVLAAGAWLAELGRRLGGYESLRDSRWSFLPLAFSSSGSPLYIWIDPARTAASAAEEMSPAYAAAVEGLATPGMLVLMLAAIIVGAAIGAWLGSPLWKRGQARIYIRKA